MDNQTETTTAVKQDTPKTQRVMGCFSATMIVVASMIGTGVFTTTGILPNTGSFTPIQSFINGENLKWTENATYDYVIVATSDYSTLDIIGFSFKVGSDLKTALDIIGTPIGGEITQITQEEYENIFNS